jgi:hypothetical protein
VGYEGGYLDGYAEDGGAAPTEHFGALAVAGVGSFAAAGALAAAGAVTFSGIGTVAFSATGGIPVHALVSFAGTSSFLPVVRFTGTDYQLLVVDKAGSLYGEVENARIGSVTFELNGAGGLDFTLPVTDPDCTLIQPGREVQLYRGNQLLFWGPVVRQQIGLDEASYQCAGLLWYFERRFMGRADRTNLLVNGDFEASEASWTFEAGVGHSISFTTKVEGAKSLRLAGSVADHGQHAEQVYTHTTAYHPDGDAVIVSAWVYVPSADYLGGAVNDIGLVVVHKRAGVVIGTPDVAEIGDDFVMDQWVPLEVLAGAVKAGDTVEVQLFPPHGVAFYDLVTATLMESLSFWPGQDVATIVAGIVNYAQDNGVFTHGKSDLNIGTAGAATGVVKDVTYQFAEHRNIADAIFEYVREGVIDVDIAITPTARTFTTYAPRKGHYRSDLPLTLDTTVADFSWSWDGEAAATSVVVLGPGDGPDRPEGGATDTTAIGGLTLEWVEVAPDDVTVGGLDDRAAQRLRIGVNPAVIEATTLPGVGIIGQLQTGDTVPVAISRGPLAINTTYRAVAVTVNPHTDQATVTLNPEV